MPTGETQAARGAGPRFAFVLPVYDHPATVAGVVEGLKPYGCPIAVVDDGSAEPTRRVLDGLSGIQLLRHPANLGKGAALQTGLRAVADVADWAITLDADGQHDPADARRFMEAAAQADGRALLVGRRRGMGGPNTPWTSRFGRGFSNFWVRSGGGPRLADTQSGYRAYPLPETLRLGIRARRFQWEVEVLVLACWKGLPVHEVEVGVLYAPRGERISHFRPWVDFWRNAGVFSRLIVQRMFVPRSRRARWQSEPDADSHS